jgi:Ser/Thr protein kinase RdoA (MazF antagonist)
MISIRDVRQRILSDDALDRILEEFSLPWVREFEQKSIQTKWCCIHGDLHGCNVLVKTDGLSIIIDYGDVEPGPASLDPVTLELRKCALTISRLSWPNRVVQIRAETTVRQV